MTAIDPYQVTPCAIEQIRHETADTFTLEMTPSVEGSYQFAPGQFNMLYVFGVGEVPISISGDPSRADQLVHTVRSVGGVTKAICSMEKGDSLGVRGPYGSSWPMDAAKGRDIVIVAGGIGLAPLRPAIYQLFRRRKDYGRVALLYGTRTPSDLLFEQELHHWRGRFDAEIEITVDMGTAGWAGHVGVVTTLIPWIEFDAEKTTAMVCGPEIMMRFTVQEFLARGVPEQDIYISMERNMKCAIGFCGHCQFGPAFVCKDGPVFRYDDIGRFLQHREI
ncbi:MAG: FAD/NAD(P)-binding protein [Planctomycetota bacterium]|nr:FAD/NAD(P)-binding protein [Planctomycetota bacterium]